jgi:hypothetical protein
MIRTDENRVIFSNYQSEFIAFGACLKLDCKVKMQQDQIRFEKT